MKRLYPISSTILAVLALGALTAIASAAEPTKLLPEPTAANPVTATGTNPIRGELEQADGLTIVCQKTKGTARFTTPNLGVGTVLFEECTSSLGTKCTGVGDATGSLEENGSVEYLLALEMVTGTTSTLAPAFVALVKQFHFVCATTGISLLVLVRGCVAGKADGVGATGTLAKFVTILSAQFTTGETRIPSILTLEATKETKCVLESNISAKESEVFTLAAIIGAGAGEKWTRGGEEIDMLFMD